MTEYVLAVDLGTGGPKVALVAPDGGVADFEFAPTKLLLSPDGGAEQDPDEWWQAILSAAHGVLERVPGAADHVVAVSCTAQWSGTVAVDAEGRALGNALIWMDCRGAEAVRRITRGFPSAQGYGLAKLQRWIRLTGGAPGHSGKDPIAHILYLRSAQPDVYERASVFLEPVDYLNLRLTGRAAASFDSIVLHWVTDNRDLRNVRYDARLLGLAGLDPGTLPPLVPTGTVMGELSTGAAEDLGVRAGLPVVTGSGDVHSAAVGSGAVRDFEAHLYIGTSSWLTCHVPFKKTSLSTNVASIPSAVPGRYFVADEHETAGACLTFLRDQVFAGEIQRWDDFNRMAQHTAPGSGGVIFTPWLNGERTPVDDHTVRAGWFNLSLSTTREEMVRAVYEGVALNSRWLLSAVEKFVGRRLDPLRFIGGGANSEIWAQIHADVLDRTVHRVTDPIQANVRGAGLLGWMALGRLGVEDVARVVKVDAVFEPDPAHRSLYDERFSEFVRLYKQNKATYRRLNGSGKRER